MRSCKFCGNPISLNDSLNPRIYCNACKKISVSSSLKLEKETRATKKYPECFTNYDQTDAICFEKCDKMKKCKGFSPPLPEPKMKSSFGQIRNVKEEINRCENCGNEDTGNFCSYCGYPLKDKTRRNFFLKIFYDGLISDWPSYFRTIFLLLSDNAHFLQGAFSIKSNLFHFENKTLNPSQFFIKYISFAAFLSIVTNFLLGLDVSSDVNYFSIQNILEEIINFLFLLCYIYVPGFLILIFIGIYGNVVQNLRRVDIIPLNTSSFETVIPALIYSSAIEIFAVPFFEVLFADIFNKRTFDSFPAFLFIVIIPLSILKILNQLWFLPNAIHFSCKIGKTVAKFAVGQFYAFVFGITKVLQFIFTGGI